MQNLQGSHLCNYKSCVLGAHLVADTQDINLRLRSRHFAHASRNATNGNVLPLFYGSTNHFNNSNSHAKVQECLTGVKGLSTFQTAVGDYMSLFDYTSFSNIPTEFLHDLEPFHDEVLVNHRVTVVNEILYLVPVHVSEHH